jgi:hypothetical protein
MAVADEGTLAGAGDGHPVRLTVDDDLKRSRLAVFFRLLLAIPHFIWVLAWGIVAFLVAVINWFATLAAGRSPAALHSFLASYVKYVLHVWAYVYLAADAYPGFLGRPGYPVDISIDPPQRQSRLSVAFRIVLALPAALIATTLGGPHDGSRSNSGSVAGTAAFLGWFASLARGRMPRGLRDVIAYALAYDAQVWAYLFMLTGRYPDSDPARILGPLPAREDPVSLQVDRDLRRSRLTVFFRLPLAIPHLVWLTLWSLLALIVILVSALATLFKARNPDALHRFLSTYVRYSTHVNAFLLLIANPFPGFAGAVGSYPVEVAVDEPQRQNRWSVFFRALLAIPAFVLATAFGSLMVTVAVLGWFASLATGRMPEGMRNAAAQGLRYQVQTYGYLFLLTGAYPYSGPTAIDGSKPSPDGPSAPASPLPATS